jgi:hypothetical protein
MRILHGIRQDCPQLQGSRCAARGSLELFSRPSSLVRICRRLRSGGLASAGPGQDGERQPARPASGYRRLRTSMPGGRAVAQ